MATPYTPEQRSEMVAHILAEVSAGRAVSRVLREDAGMPSPRQFWTWHFGDDDLQQKLARARLNGVEAIMDEAKDIADTPLMGETVTFERDPEHQKDIDEGHKVTSLVGTPYEGMIVKARREDMLGHRKLQVETRFKYAQMIAPRKYGPKIDVTSDGKAISLSAEVEAARKRAEQGGG